MPTADAWIGLTLGLMPASAGADADGCHGALGAAGERAGQAPGSSDAQRSLQDKWYDLLKHRGRDLKRLSRLL